MDSKNDQLKADLEDTQRSYPNPEARIKQGSIASINSVTSKDQRA